MKSKIVGILVSTLLIAATVIPVAGIMKNNKGIGETSSYNSDSLQQTISGSYSMTNWLEKAKLIASDGAKDDFFGNYVSIDGDYAIIGAYDDNNTNGVGAGSAYIFKRTDITWAEEAKLLASDGAKDDSFGDSVSIDGNYAIIGADLDDDNGINSGSSYIFKRDGSSWTEEAKLLASDGVTDDHFGCSVSINGDYAIVGAYYDDYYTGSAYIFKRNGTSWTEEAKLLASDGAPVDLFGCSVSINGDYAIVGAYYEDNTNGDEAGSAYIFKRTDITWAEEAKLLASDGAEDDYFGFSVSINGDYAIIGAHYDDNANGDNVGSAYIFKRTGTSWSEEAKLLASDAAPADIFGRSVSINGDYVIVGAYYDDNTNGVNAGSAYVFEREPESKCCIVIGNVTGGLFDSPPSLRVKAVIRNTGDAECTDIIWSFDFIGGIILIGPKSDTTASIPPRGTITVSSKIVIGLAGLLLFPGNVTITADAANNACQPVSKTKKIIVIGLLLKVKQ